jgi:hypothetical protein
MGTDLGHQEDAVAQPFETGAHPVFGFAAMIFPTIVEEGNTAVDRLPDQAHRRSLVGRVSYMMSAKPYGRDLDIMATERSQRYRVSLSSGHRSLPPLWQTNLQLRYH